MNTSTSTLDDVILKNKNLVYSICSKYTNYSDKEDLHQVGMIGLINAYKNYDKNKKTKFSTYAFPYIVGEVNKYVRENKSIKVSKDLIRLGRKINEYILKHKQVRGYEPSISDIALMLNTKKQTIINAINLSKNVKSLDEELNNEGRKITLLDITPKEEILNQDQMIDLKDAFHHLTDIEKKVIINRYYNNLTQSDVAKILGINQVSVSRLESKVLSKLKNIMK